MRRNRLAPSLLLLFLLATLLPLSASADDDFTALIAQGDALWARRAEGHQGGQALAGPVDAALAAYEKAVKVRPKELEGYWKVLRAVHFKGEYVARTREERQAAFGRGREVCEAALNLLAAKVGGREKLDKMTPQATAKAFSGGAGLPGVLETYLWGGADWGLWGDAFGKLAAARQGVADRVRHYAEVAIALDERFADAGGHRMLGRLHTLAPHIPFITGWIDHGKAVTELRRAVEVGPADPTNSLYLAEALLEFKPEKKAEAREILKRLAGLQPAPDLVVEQEKVAALARALLAKG